MKNKQHPYRGIKKRLDRKAHHKKRTDFESLMFKLKQEKRIVLWVKDVKNDHTPTDYFVAEFHLKDKMTLKDFEELLYIEMGVLL